MNVKNNRKVILIKYQCPYVYTTSYCPQNCDMFPRCYTLLMALKLKDIK